jgi:hypothetical protein
VTAGKTEPTVAILPACDNAKMRGVAGPISEGDKPTALITTVFCTKQA